MMVVLMMIVKETEYETALNVLMILYPPHPPSPTHTSIPRPVQAFSLLYASLFCLFSVSQRP